MIDNNALVQQTAANDIVEERHHAIAVAVATAAAAEARPSTFPSHYNNYDYAAILIQTAFRGYLVSLDLLHQFNLITQFITIIFTYPTNNILRNPSFSN